MSGQRRFRPGTASLIGMMVLNAVAATVALKVVFLLFGVVSIVAAHASGVAAVSTAAHWDVLWPMVPGAAVGFSLLWFWLVITGRAHGLNWGSAFLKGVLIAFGNVLCGGLLVGVLNGNPSRGLLLGFIMLIAVPQVWASMAVFGATMALINGNMASRWIERHKAG